MQKVTAKDQTLLPDPESAVESTESTGDDTRGIGGRLVKLNPSLAALVTWLVCLPVAFAAATLGQADPFRLRVAMIPVVVLVAGVIAVGLASRRLPADLASGIAAGLFGGWVAFTLRVAVHGTPFGFGGLGSDAGRLAAMANRYSHAWRSSDAIVPSVPSHYPPLFPWLVGRLSALLHVPAWRLLSPAEAITLSFVVIAGYLLWRRLLSGPLALAVTLPVLLCFALPSKVYEILALAVFIPWAVATFGDPPRASCAGCRPADRRPEHRPELGLHHLRCAGPAGAGGAHLAGQPGPGAVCPARDADDPRGRGRGFLVLDPLSGLGAPARFQPG